MSSNALDDLPPEARFAVRALAAGSSAGRTAELLGTDGATLHKHLRTVVRATGGDAPPPSAGEDALLEALGPALELARAGPGRRPATPCLPEDVLTAIGTPAVHGPLLLAALEHAADCAACLTAVRERAGTAAAAESGLPPRGRLDVYLGLGIGLAVALWYLFAR